MVNDVSLLWNILCCTIHTLTHILRTRHIHLQPAYTHTSHTRAHAHIYTWNLLNFTILADITGCLSTPCKRNGTCSESGEGYKCACIKGYGHANCDGWYCTPYAGSLNVQCPSITSKMQTKVLVILMHEFDQRFGVSYFVICLRQIYHIW